MSNKNNIHNELKKEILVWLLDNENNFQRVRGCTSQFKQYIYTANGDYLIGGKEVASFIRDADKMLFR